jgi:hypothetical protein
MGGTSLLTDRLTEVKMLSDQTAYAILGRGDVDENMMWAMALTVILA